MDNGKASEAGVAPLSSPDRPGPDGKSDTGQDLNHDSPSTRSADEKPRFSQLRNNEFARRCWEVLTWTPKRCRWDPDDPPKFNMALNLLFGFVSLSLSRFI